MIYFNVSATDILVSLLFVALMVWGLKSLYAKPKIVQQLEQLLPRVNKEEKLNFTLSDTTVMGSATGGALILFDADNKKLLFFEKDSHSIHDYDHIRDWEVTWSEQTVSTVLNTRTHYSKIGINVMTRDLKRPIFTVPMYVKSTAETWNQRLAILLRS